MIRKLPPHLIHQIAAGEVIERPASVLKELIENSLDAQASRIFVQMRTGGLDFLSVEDDGWGIAEADLPLAFESHATSKLETIDDFNRLNTFGFRGEALASIGSVADVTLVTSHKESEVGFILRNAFGHLHPVTVADKREGTLISIRGLFERLPARLKFMKSGRAESQALLQVFKRYALALPHVSFHLKDVESEKEWRSEGQNDFERALWYFDAAESEDWLQIRHEKQGWKLSVTMLNPALRGRARAGIQLFLNSRFIRDSKLEFAVRKGFEGFTDTPKEISLVLRLEGPPQEFDVNVHPTKNEVRWTNAEFLFSFIYEAIRAELSTLHRVTWSAPAKSVAPPEIIQKMIASPRLVETIQREEVKRDEVKVVPLSPAVTPTLFEMPSDRYELWGVLDATYLVVKKGIDLFLFDQHALHERILYEKLLYQWNASQKLTAQRLLFPIPVHLDIQGLDLEVEARLEKLGFELRWWNDGKIQIVSTPPILKRNVEGVVKELLRSSFETMEGFVRDALATIACHSAVRAHDVLERGEIERLLKDFQSEDALGHCPHGRPTFVRLQKKDLERMFHRVL